MSSICLNMIVKNESHIITQTLENLCKNIHFDYWVICDTGSTDNTIELIKQFFAQKKIKGEVHQDKWVNFSHNRNLALKRCENKTDYVFIFDADDYIEGNLIIPPHLEFDSYHLKLKNENSSTIYLRQLLLRNNGNFYWRGVVHEFIDQHHHVSSSRLEGNYAIVSCRKGDRSRDNEKYLKDAQLLEKAIKENQDVDLHSRYAFYCARSYNDADMPELAIKWFHKRTEMENGWSEEKYYSYLQLGFLYENKKDYANALYCWQQGAMVNPQRAECWYHLARRNRWDNRSEISHLFAQRSLDCTINGLELFLEQHIYTYWRYYEACFSALNIGKIQEAYAAFKQMLFASEIELRLVDQIQPYFAQFKPLIQQDHFSEVNKLIERLKLFDRSSYLEQLI